ncbi:Ni/Fe-hydrogenase cytochrome b subunit [bacterium]|nr:Ni/Fe-hydrogenase cytochrome b subunit [bacterium]
MDRVRAFKTVLWSILGLAASVGITRFVFGLGAVTNLTDQTPWGLWIGFDVVSGVALAAGGFVITATVYILGKEEFRPIVKPAVLTAFLGYIAVIVGLMFDLGLPWNIWHMIVFWQHHSPLFEVGWCVMLYTTVLLLEFSPVPLEEASRYAKIRGFLMKYRLLFVILGIMLSTLHQSSLGSLFLIMPYRIHALWHTPILPILFLISAVGLGLMMVCLESLVTSFLYRRHTELQLLSKLGRAAAWALLLYFIVRIGEIVIAGDFGLIFNGQWESYLFTFEMLFAVIIPMILLFVPAVRRTLTGMWVCSIMVVLGFVINRINTSGVSMIRNAEGYFPSWMEFAVSAGVVSAAILAFMFMVEKFKVWEYKACQRDEEADPHAIAHFDRASQAWLGEPDYSGRIKYSLAFIIAAAVGFALIPGSKIYSEGKVSNPTSKARGGDTLVVDGNRDYNYVVFDHKTHEVNNGGEESCVKCHHMNRPFDRQSGCWECHSEMYIESDAFGHDWHASPNGGKLSCDECHAEGIFRSAENTKKCSECHNDLIPADAAIAIEKYNARSYVDAMHKMCIDCHEIKTVELERAGMTQCAFCHDQEYNIRDILVIDDLEERFNQNWLIVPLKK